MLSSESSSGSSSKRPAAISKEYYDKATYYFARDHSGEVESAVEESTVSDRLFMIVSKRLGVMRII